MNLKADRRSVQSSLGDSISFQIDGCMQSGYILLGLFQSNYMDLFLFDISLIDWGGELHQFEIPASLCFLDQNGNLCHLDKKSLDINPAEILNQTSGEDRRIV